MAVQIFDTDVNQPGMIADLGSADDAYVSKNASLTCTASVAIEGVGNHQAVDVYGSVSAYGVAITLGNDATADYLERVFVGNGGSVFSQTGAAVAITGASSFCENHGDISGYYGIGMSGDDPSGANSSSLVNSGIVSGSYDAVRHLGDEKFVFTNNGSVETMVRGMTPPHSAYSGIYSTGKEVLINNGTIAGAILFGTGDDVYRGSKGLDSGGIISGNAGDDVLIGGKNQEKLQGDIGQDLLTGNGGADHFIFVSASDSTIAKAGRDLITDFSQNQHDRIDLSQIDAKSSTGGDDSFTFIGTSAFDGHAGELRYQISHGNTFVAGDVDGDKHADFQIELTGDIHLVKTDFML
jgi:Ca2+-binding RTX toxin-like protein